MTDITIESISPIAHKFSVAINGSVQDIVIPGINSLGIGYQGKPVATMKINSDVFDAIKRKYGSSNIVNYYSIQKLITTQPKGK